MSNVHVGKLAVLAAFFASFAAVADGPVYHRLTKIPTPKIVAAAEAFRGGGWEAANILNPRGASTEYASNGKSAQTFVDFDLGQAAPVAAFRHVQRRWPDTVAEALLVFSDSPDFAAPKATVSVHHVDESEAETFATFEPVAARYVRWQVTSLVKGTSPNVGGKGVEFFSRGDAEPQPAGIAVSGRTLQVIDREGQALVQPFHIVLDSPYTEKIPAVVRVADQEPKTVDLVFGKQTVAMNVVASDTAHSVEVAVEVGGARAVSQTVSVAAAAKRTVYILPHSHTDIGYTAVQTDIEEKQINNLLKGMAEAKRTADYPKGARFVWNVEVLWAADLFLQRLPEKARAEFERTVKSGQVALNGMYLNELTGLCRPEELVRLFRYATRLGERTGVPVTSAMISDVPGYTWGTVPAMSQAGIRYFSVAPNYCDRIGDIMVQWENKPFWWVGPDGQSKVLVWIPFWGYAMSHRYGKMSRQLVDDFCEGLESRGYPYDIAYVRWSGHGDNAVPDASICDFVREWNAAHAWPQFVIASTAEAFAAFEKRYGDRLPQVRGDWSPYWEDGAGSSAAETAMNRANSERLRQAETLWALRAPARYPAERFEDAWRNVLLYSEHTWGAYCSVSQPDVPFTMDQWVVKQSYATSANLQSRQLMTDAAQSGAAAAGNEDRRFVDIYNTSSWPRGGVALIPHELSDVGDGVVDEQGAPAGSQRLVSGELAVLVRELPPFSGRRYVLRKEGQAARVEGGLKVGGATLENSRLRVRVDEKTGGIVELAANGIAANLADVSGGEALNDYRYLNGDDVAQLQRNGPVRVSVYNGGPLVASLAVESDAPGCHRLFREVRLTATGDFVELFNRVDKRRLEAKNYFVPEGKESINFAFPFCVPGGEIRMDVPFGVFRPEKDQMPSACKNWLTVGSWADVANDRYGVTWVTLDAPLVEVGGVTANLLNSQANPNTWRKHIEPTQKLYSWAMNNHWHTNYRAYQEGPVEFRFALRPHGAAAVVDAARFAADCCEPLVALPGRGDAPDARPLVSVVPADVLATALKPSDDGQALILRLFNAGDAAAEAKLAWGRQAPRHLWITDTSERPIRKWSADQAVPIPAQGVVALRVELGL